jgi:hypothetical protein
MQEAATTTYLFVLGLDACLYRGKVKMKWSLALQGCCNLD